MTSVAFKVRVVGNSRDVPTQKSYFFFFSENSLSLCQSFRLFFFFLLIEKSCLFLLLKQLKKGICLMACPRMDNGNCGKCLSTWEINGGNNIGVWRITRRRRRRRYRSQQEENQGDKHYSRVKMHRDFFLISFLHQIQKIPFPG